MRPHSAFAIRGPAMGLCDVISGGYFKQVRLLVEMGIHLDDRDNEGKSPLILCVYVEPESWGLGMARILIENGADISVKDRCGMNALHHACVYGRFQLAKTLLNALDFDLNEVDRFGNTALHYAVRAGDSMITKLIIQCLKRYNLTLETPNKHGHTALQEAYKLKQLSCVKLLEEDDTFEAPCSDTNLIPGFETSQPPKDKPTRRCLRECCRTPPPSGFIDYYRESRFKPLKPNQKNPALIIKIASPKDFRNTKENIFKLTAVPLEDDISISQESLPAVHRAKTAIGGRRPSKDSSHNSPRYSWRDELRNLYQSFEFQCARSWRRPVKPVEIKIEAPSMDDLEVEKLYVRRGRRTSTCSRLGLGIDLSQRRRSSVVSKLGRKGSTSASDRRDTLSVASSTESLCSVTIKSPKSKGDLSPRSPN